MTPSGALEDPFGLSGAVLEGQYRADLVVGEGGFGVVYRGRHLSLDQPIAIKVLKGLDGGDPSINALVLEKFRAEAKLLYTLSQSSLHIVRCLDFGATTTPSGAWAPFMILEWLDGQSLADDLEERRSRGMRGRSVHDTLAILTPVADGLAIAHQRQVAHRDVKPANIFLLHGGRPGQQGQVKVLDFGIAKIMKDGESAGTKGTFASFTWLYAAPEQLDPRLGASGLATDVYGFALLLTELLTDRQPIEDRNVIDIMRSATNPTRRPTPRTRGANIPNELEAVCQRALAVDPRNRFASITELWQAVMAASGGGRGATTTQAQPAPPSIAITPASSPGVPSSGTPANPMAATGFAAPSGVTPQGRMSALPGSMQAVSMQAASQAASSMAASRQAQAQAAASSQAASMQSVLGPTGLAQPHQQPQPQPQPQRQSVASPGPPQGQMTGLPVGAPPYTPGSPPLGTHPPSSPFAPPPPMQQPQPPQFGGPPPPQMMMPYPQQPHPQTQVSPPFGTMPPGQMMRRLPFVRTDGTSPVVYVTIIFFILALMLAGTCAAVHGACDAGG